MSSDKASVIIKKCNYHCFIEIPSHGLAGGLKIICKKISDFVVDILSTNHTFTMLE